MASRHDIIHIDFQANAGKANVALQALQQEADKARQKVDGLRTQLQNARNTNMPTADIQKLEAELKLASKESKQWQQALQNNMKGVRALDEAIKTFNNGKGTVEGMNAALSKTALNAAELQKKRSDAGSQTWKEMDALIVALQQNIMKCNTAMNSLVSTIKNGGTSSKATLTQAKTDLQQMIALEEQGSKAWVKYTSQLKTVEGALNKITLEEQRMAGQNALAKVFSGEYITKSNAEIEKLIAQVKQYQATIADPEGKGARHFRATETALQKLSAQLGKTKGDIVTVQQALKVASAAGTANRFGSGLDVQGNKLAQAYRATGKAITDLQQKRQTYTILQQNGITLTAQEQAQLAKLDAQIASTTAKHDRLRNEMIQVGEANNLTTKGISQSIQLLRQQQETVAAGSPSWQKYEAAIASLENRMKIMRGEAISLFDAMRLSQKAGGQGFTGTAKQLQMAEQAIQKAAATAQKGSPAWEKYQQALAKVRVEMQNAGMTSEKMRSILDKPANARNLNELQAAVKRAKAELDLMAGTVGKNSKAYTELASQTKKAEIQLKQLQAQSHGTASAFDKAWSRLKTYIGLYVGAAVAMQKLVGTMSDIMELSDKMGEVRKTTGFTADEVGRLTTELRKMDTRTSLNGLMELASVAGTLGLKTQEDVQGFTEAANKLMVALPEMGKEGAKEMLKVALATGEIDKIRKQMEEGLIDGSSATAVAMEKIGSTIDRLRASSASAAPAITDFVKRVGAVGAQSGISIDQVAALGSTVDTLGMRVEMSATALSRMIPAIKNNAFAVAKAIGVTPETLRGLFDAGRGMEAILMIFQHIKDQGMDEDSVEKMLNMGGMQEIMKELNQMGARAGIVFAGLSQNVDELRRQLGVAAQAYEENTAIQQEYDKMNETAAAKWERLKNQLEETFVGDTAQRLLGGLVDALRGLVDFLTGNVGPAFSWLSGLVQTFLVYWALLKIGLGEGIFVKAIGGLKAMGLGLVNLISNTRQYMVYSALLSRAQLQLKTASDAATVAMTKQKIAAIEARMAQEGLNKAMIANVWMALVAAIGFVIYKLYQAANAANELNDTFHRLQAEEEAAERDVNRLTDSFKKTSSTLTTTTKKHEELTKKTEALRKEVDEMKKSTDESTEASDELKKKEEELTKSEGDLKKATEDMNKAKKEHNGVIAEINSKYSSYLGYMLSEVTNAGLVESAHWRIVAALRAELEKKRELENQKAIEKKYSEDIQEWTQDSRNELKSLPRDVQDQIMRRRSNMMAQVSYDMKETVDKNGKTVVVGRFVVPAIDGIGNQPKQFATEQEARNYLKKLTATIVQQETIDRGISLGKKTRTKTVKGDYLGTTKRVTETTGKEVTAEEFVNRIWGGAYGSASFDDGFQRLTTAELKRMEDQARQRYQDQGSIEGANTQLNKTTLADIRRNAYSIATTLKETKNLTDQQISELGRQLNAVVQSSTKYGGSTTDVQVYFGANKDMTLDNAAAEMLKGLDEKTRNKVIAAARKNERAGTGGSTAPTYTGSNPWGSRQPAESTNYADMNAEALVARRKQMKDFVNAIQTDTDVQSVLKEDAALKKAIEKGMSSDMRTVIEWYNTERLKIQDELHARYLTNTGDWQDPKKQEAAHKQFKAELDAYLEELDAYYTERKTEIEKARSDDEITEGEAWRRNLKNENEWYQRRAELMMLYGEKAGDVTKEEQDRIVKIIAERTGDSVEFVRAMIKKTIGFAKQIEKSGEKGAAMVHDWYAKLDLNTQRSFLKSQQVITKQVKFIEDTLAKERPYDGITKNLQDNLDKMGVLAARMRKVNDELTAKGEQPKYSDADVTAQSYKEMAFYLRQAEDAYRIDITTLLKRMADEGMEETAKEIAESDMLKQAVMGQLRKTYQEVHDAIKKEASQIKKDVELLWNDETLGPDGKSIKANFDKVIAQLGMQQDSVSRANSLIGAGSASDNVASRIAMKQLQVQMDMQRAQFNMFRTQAHQRIAALKAEAAEKERISAQLREQKRYAEAEEQHLKAVGALRDADNVRRSLGLTLAEETKKEEEYQAELLKQQEEIQNRLYTSLREWADLLASSVQSLFEAEHAGDAEYYNERAKLDLTGKGGPGAGTYIVIDNEGTSDAKAHYEYLDERQALERQHEIEQENARAEAWKEVMDEFNQKMSETITDQLNALLQNASIDANTQALIQNTKAIYDSMNQTTGDAGSTTGDTFKRNEQGFAVDNSGQVISPVQPVDVEQPAEQPKSYWPMSEEHKEQIKEWQTELWQNNTDTGIAAMQAMTDATAEMPSIVTNPYPQSQEQVEFISQTTADAANAQADAKIEASKRETDAILANQQAVRQSEQQNDQQMVKTNKASFAAMTAAANMYGIAYQAMSNDNLSTAQRVQMMIVQAAGQAAMTMLTVAMSADTAETAMHAPAWISKTLKDLGPIGGPVAVGVFTALIGGLMGLATSKITKAKSQISQATGASVGAGRLATGMLTYKDGNVNELTDPASLTPGRSYNVDGADGKTYRAKYTGKNPRTHITNGPEFHLVGEAGREAIIDAHTTRLMQMDDTGIWQAIQTLYNGGSISAVRRGRNVGRGIRAFKDGNLDDFEEIGSEMGGGDMGDTGMNMDVMVSMQETNSRLADLLEQALTNGIKAVNKWDGPDGIPNMYNKYQKEAQRHGEKYL